MNIVENSSDIKQEDSFNLKQEFLKYLPYWYWFVVGVLFWL